MDPRRFDRLARSVAAAPSRRTVLALLAGGSLAADLARLGPVAAVVREAAAASGHRPCDRNSDCRNGAYCHRKKSCRCRRGRVDCDGVCVARGECCIGYSSPCTPDGRRCCGVSSCTGTLRGRRVCCGIEIHECAAGTADPYCCSKECLPSGKCAPLPAVAAIGDLVPSGAVGTGGPAKDGLPTASAP